MNNHCHGDPIQFEFSSADATTAAPLVIRDAGGLTHTLNANERVYIQTLNIQAAAGTGTVTIFDDRDGDGVADAGERMLLVGEGFSNVPFVGTDEGTAGGVGRVPKVQAVAAGQISITGIGIIRRG